MESLAGKWTFAKLFRRRVLRFWHEQWKVWRTALDWTVWLYVVIPGLWIGGGLYVDVWQHPPHWLTVLPIGVGERIPLVVILIGRLRTFTEDADVLILLQKKKWGRGLVLRGIGYTSIKLAFLTALVYVLLLPFLVPIHHLPTASIVSMIIYTWIWSWISSLWRNLLEARFVGLRKWVGKLAAMALLAVTYFYPITLVGEHWRQLFVPISIGVIVLLVTIRVKLRASDTFDSDVQQEHKARLASTQLLLRGVIDRKPRIRLNRPLVLRQSNRIFKRFDAETILSEMIIKTFIRRLSLIRLWFVFVGISMLAISLSPSGLKPFLVVILPLLLSAWVQSHWRAVLAESYVAQFRWSDSALRQSAEQVRMWLVVPCVVLLSMIGGLQTYGIWGVLSAVPAILIWIAVNKFQSAFMLLKPKEKGGPLQGSESSE
ncbi:ABC transporter permease [Paenibacillus baekrokdamisoli]|uniref:ABC transporter permease n=1 Tax=Paenibacillus baekrokdamisoli TaxID=1712516 RepID=A0A3G9J7U9_9BACL|nr:ABC transporter permease [Paenibacillus baekrokdamisoli]MBB3071588.1 ABC-2 type transport system permease protein [Paenibacillus baekrokdamisoli]BBH21901.1 ABC transporter permease [Paenibacillus baekrokdamisoli]